MVVARHDFAGGSIARGELHQEPRRKLAIMTTVKTLKTCIAPVVLLVLVGCGGETSTTPSPAPPAAATSKAPDENAALDALAKIHEAQSVYFKRNRRYALAFDELVEARDLKAEPTTSDTGYEFRMRPAADAQTYSISAAPASPSTRYSAPHLFTDQTGVIRGEQNIAATAQSPVFSTSGPPAKP